MLHLQDHYDVKMPAHLLLGKLAATAPAYVIAVLDRLVPPLQKTLTAKLKSDAVKQEVCWTLISSGNISWKFLSCAGRCCIERSQCSELQ